MTLTWLTDTVTSDLDRAVHYTLLWGLEGVELRTVGGPADRVPYVNEEKVRRRLREHDLPVVAVVPGFFEGAVDDRATWMNELLHLEEVARFCERLGCPRIVVGTFAGAYDPSAMEQVAEALRRAGAVAERHGVRLAVLNEGRTTCSTGAHLAEVLAAVGRPAVQAAWHPVHALRAGEHPLDGLMALAGRVALVRCMDGVLRDGAWQHRPLGDGEVGWPEQLDVLRRQGFDGPLSLEVHMEPRPTQGLRMATTLITMLRAASER